MEEEIMQAVALLMKNGFVPESISSSVAFQKITKISLELSIMGIPPETIQKKLIFEKAWLQKIQTTRPEA